MSTIKATNIQPQSDSDPLVFSTNATERMRIPSSGGVSITGGATVYGDIEVFDGAFVRSGGLSVTGSASISQNMTVGSNLTVGSSTLSTPSGSAPMFVCRAYCTVVAASASSISSQVGQNLTATNPAAGRYDFTFTTNMSNENYAVVISNSTDFSNRVLVGNAHSNSNGTSIAPTASGFSVGFQTTGGVAQNPRFFSVAVFA